jgi:Big-like domain-containing protein
MSAIATVAAGLLVTSLAAQPVTRRATNLAALLNYPAFYQMRPVVLVGTMAMSDKGRIQVSDETGTLQVIYKGSPPDGLAEIRGEFWDVGRMNADDPRLASMNLQSTFGIDPTGPWPRAGQVLAVVASTITSITPPSTPSVRTMVLFPARYREQKVTVVGQFAGRNLLGDLPDAPARSRFDFVLRSADAAVWVTNLRPRGKDFELALDARIDTGRWLEVTGTLQQGRGLQWLDAETGSLKLAKAPSEQPEETVVRVPAAPPPEVIFSAPTEGETDVLPGTTIRIQFSRDINPETLKGRIKVLYTDGTAESGTPITEFTTEYRGAARVLEVKFTKPLEPFRAVRLSFDDGVLGTDKQPLKPWTLAFEVAGG